MTDAQWYALAADLVAIFHASYIFFYIGGVVLLLGNLKVLWLIFGYCFLVDIGLISNIILNECPLTAAEKHLRNLAGQAVFKDSFIVYYLKRIGCYPGCISPESFDHFVGLVMGAIFVFTCFIILVRRIKKMNSVSHFKT